MLVRRPYHTLSQLSTTQLNPTPPYTSQLRSSYVLSSATTLNLTSSHRKEPRSEERKFIFSYFFDVNIYEHVPVYCSIVYVQYRIYHYLQLFFGCVYQETKYITLRRRTQVSNRMQRLTVLKSIRPSPAKHIAHDQKFTRLPCINLNITIQALILFHATFHCQLGPIGSPRALHATHPDQPRTETKNK